MKRSVLKYPVKKITAVPEHSGISNHFCSFTMSTAMWTGLGEMSSNPLYIHLLWAFITVVWSTALVSAFRRARPHAICEPDGNNNSGATHIKVDRDRARPQRNNRKPVKSAVLDSGLAAAHARPSSSDPFTTRAKFYTASQPSAAVRERVREWLLRIEGNTESRARDTKPNAPATVPEESTESSQEEVLPFGPLRRPILPIPGVSLPRSKSFERMMTNDRQPPSTPLARKSHSSGSLFKSHSSGSLFYANIVMQQSSGPGCMEWVRDAVMINDRQAPPTPVAHRCHSLSSGSLF
jgi:hypothetical protein